MNLSYLQFLFAMVLVIDGIMCNRGGHQRNKTTDNQQDNSSNQDQGMLQCRFRGNDDSRNFTVTAKYSPLVLQNVSLVVNANITCGAQEEGRWSGGASRTEYKLSCPTHTSYEIALVSFNYHLPMNRKGNLTIICWKFCRKPVNVFGYQSNTITVSCRRTPNELQVTLFASRNVNIRSLNTIVFAPDPPGSKSLNPMTTVTTNGQPQSTTANPTTTVTTITPPQPTSADPMTTVTTTGQSQSTTANPTTTVTTITPPQPTFVNQITRAVTSNKRSQPNFANTTTTVKTDGSSKSNSGKRITLLIVVPTVVVLVAVFLLVALVATIRRKRRNKQASEGNGTIALNIRSTVNQNEKTAVYNEIGEQDYNTLFGGKERGDYHEYNVPDRPQERTSVDRTRASGSGPYQELFQDGTHAVAAVNRSPGVTGHRHGVAGDLHAYQDIRQDDRSVSGSHPNREMPNQLLSKDTPATENGYQAVKTATPEYATLEPSPEYATLEQNDESMTATSDVSGPPSDKQYDTLQRSINTVGQPPSAGYGTLKPMNEADADYESPDGYSKTTSDVNDSTRPTEALPNNQPKTRHPGAYGDDDYQTPIEPAEDLTNAYQTLDNPGYQQEPDTQAEEYSQLQRSLGAKLQSHPSSNHDNSDSYGKLHLNGTP